MRIVSLLALTMMLSMGSYPLNAFAEISEDVRQSFENGDFANALNLIEQNLEKDSDDQKLLLTKGYLLVKLNQLDGAAEYYKTLATRLSDNPEPGNNLAMVYRMQGKYNQAIEMFDQTIEQFPDYSHAYENLGDTYIELAHQRYQAGLDASGEALLKKKVNLSQNFHQLAVQAPPKPEQSYQANASPKTSATNSGAQSALAKATGVDGKTAEPEKLVVSALESWISDWMSLDAERYLSHYSSEFIPSNGIPLKQWVARKKQILATAGAIKLKLSNIDIQFEQDNVVIAKFTQEYQSNTLKDISHKTLGLIKDQDRWLILKETSESQ